MTYEICDQTTPYRILIPAYERTSGVDYDIQYNVRGSIESYLAQGIKLLGVKLRAENVNIWITTKPGVDLGLKLSHYPWPVVVIPLRITVGPGAYLYAYQVKNI